MADKLIVHISITPLVGAPMRIVKALNEYSHYQARLINLNSSAYGGMTFQEDLVWKKDKDKEEALELIKKADVIHMHHYFDFQSDINRFGINFKELAKESAVFVRHFHSAPGLVFGRKKKDYKTFYTETPSFVIPHYPSRYYPQSKIVPNIIPINDSLYLPQDKVSDSKKVRVAFSPSSKRSAFAGVPTRWDTKSYVEVIKIIKKLKRKVDFDFDLIHNVPHEECMARKKQADIVIDDVSTGSMHLSALEGLSQGSVVLSYLDDTVYNNFLSLTGSKELPVVNVWLDDLGVTLEKLIKDNNLRKDLAAYSRKWIENYYSDEAMIKFYEDSYDCLLRGEELKPAEEFGTAKSFLRKDMPNYNWKGRRGSSIFWRGFSLAKFLLVKEIFFMLFKKVKIRVIIVVKKLRTIAIKVFKRIAIKDFSKNLPVGVSRDV